MYINSGSRAFVPSRLFETSSVLGHSPTHRDTNTTGSMQESNLLRLKVLQDDRAASMAVGDPANPTLAMIGIWATENSQNVNPGLNGHVGDNHGTTGYGINNNSINRHGMNSYDQHTSIAPSISVLDPKLTEMRHGPSHQPVPNGDLTTGVSDTTEAVNNKPRRADLEPMQRWVDENAKEQPWNGVEMRRDKV